MIDHVWTIICSRAVIDKESNNISIQNVIEQITSSEPKKPNTILAMRLDVASMLIRRNPGIPARKNLRVCLQFPSGNVDQVGILDINLLQHETYRSIVHLNGIPAREPGRHYFLIEIEGETEEEWNQVAAVPLTLKYRSQEESLEEE